MQKADHRAKTIRQAIKYQKKPTHHVKTNHHAKPGHTRLNIAQITPEYTAKPTFCGNNYRKFYI